MTSPLAVCWFWLRLSAFLHRGTSPRYTDRDGRRQRASQIHRGHSSVTVTKQCITPVPLHYQHAPCWEIYLRSVILSAKQPSTGTHRWLILSRHRLVYHCLVREIRYSHSLLRHRSGQSCRELKRCTGRLIIWPVNGTQRMIYTVRCSLSAGIFSPKCICLFLDNCYHMEAIPFMLFPCSDSWKKYSNRAERKAFYVFDLKIVNSSGPDLTGSAKISRFIDWLIERKLFTNYFDNWSCISVTFTPKM